MKDRFIKVLALVLAVTLFTISPLETFANKAEYLSNLEDAITLFECMYPNSEITVVDGEIHIAVMPVDSKEPTVESRSVAYNAAGGSFYNFRAPASYVDQDAMRPVSKVYLPKAQAEALYAAKMNPGLLDAVCEQFANGTTMSTIIQNTQTAYGVTLTSAGISFLAAFATIATLTMIDRIGISTAMSNGTKGRLIITKTIAYGVPATTYEHWQANTISEIPWEDWNPWWVTGRYIGYSASS